jgi:hypothetical protein
VFPVRYELDLYILQNSEFCPHTVTLRVVGGDEKGRLKYETVKYGHESKGTGTQEGLRWRGTVACTKDRPVLSSERAERKKISGRDSQVTCPQDELIGGKSPVAK